MIRKDPEQLLSIILQVLKNTGQRGIICEGWFTLKKPEAFNPSDYGLSDNQILFIKEAPHTWLLPRCSLIVCHGGAGTTIASVMSGRPVVICPFLIDQPVCCFLFLRLFPLFFNQNISQSQSSSSSSFGRIS